MKPTNSNSSNKGGKRNGQSNLVGANRIPSNNLVNYAPSQRVQQDQKGPQPISTSRILGQPTSLANLAQFSGLTLLPIARPINNNINNNLNQFQSNVATSNRIAALSSGSGSSSLASRLQSSMKTQMAATGNTPIDATRPNVRQTPFNLSSISSIQLINQTAATPLTGSVSAGQAAVRNRINEHSQRLAAVKPRNPPQVDVKTKINLVNNNINCDFQPTLAPCKVEHSLALNIHNQQPNSTFSDLHTNSSQPKIGHQESELNNFTLMKLVAILNNPALSLTPVLGPLPTIADSPVVSMDRNKPNRNLANNFDRIDSLRTFNDNEIVPEHRIPQSFANLQAASASTIDNNSASFQSSQFIKSQQNCNSDHSIQRSLANRCHDTLDGQRSNHSMNCNINIKTNKQSISASTFKPSTSTPKRDNNSHNNDSSTNNVTSKTVQNLITQQNQPQNNRSPNNSSTPTISVELLRQTVNRESLNDDWAASEVKLRSLLETECSPVSLENLKQLPPRAKRTEKRKLVSSSPIKPKKKLKEHFYSTKDRLLNPVKVEADHMEKRRPFELQTITVEDDEQVEVQVSDRHSILETMMSEASEELQNIAPEPDEIFINRPKRIMSKIDTSIERKKRRRFERISSREAPKTYSLEQQLAESEAEWSEDDTNSVGFIKTQLPLEEKTTKEKLDFFHSVGLVSREHKNRLLIEQCEDKLKLFSPLKLTDGSPSLEGIEKFSQLILESHGTDTQWRIESSIKRNDLPFIEGLNRNTSRLKIAFMNTLGLDKRSKRTTLYRVRPLGETSNLALKQSDGDVMMVKNVNNDLKRANLNPSQPSRPPTMELNMNIKEVSKRPNANKISAPSCREAMKMPDKNEYMKSLGLMAS